MKLQTTKQNLPTNIEDLSKFVLVGQRKAGSCKSGNQGYRESGACSRSKRPKER